MSAHASSLCVPQRSFVMLLAAALLVVLAVCPRLPAAAALQGRLETATYEGVDLRVTAEHTARLESVLASYSSAKPKASTAAGKAAAGGAAGAKPAKPAKGAAKDTGKAAAADTATSKKGLAAKVATGAAAAGKNATAGAADAPITPADYPKLWAAYKKQYKKKYTPAQEKTRYAAFVARATRAAAKEARAAARTAAKEKATGKKKPASKQRKAGKRKFTAGNAVFGDMTDAKFKSLNGGRPKKNAAHAKFKVFDPKKPRRPLKKGAAGASSAKKPTTKKARFAQLGASPLSPLNIPKVSTIAAPRDAGSSGPKRAGSGDSTAGTGVDAKSMAADKQGFWDRFVGYTAPWSNGESGVMITYDLRNMFPFGRDDAIVRNQGLCRSCWAQASAEHAQAIIAVGTNYDKQRDMNARNPRLSAQQIIDCARTADDTGCNGGTVAGQQRTSSSRDGAC
jgi:hypothetical protein